MLTIPSEALPTTNLGQDIKGDARIAGLFYLTQWEDLTRGVTKYKLGGQLILPTGEGNTRAMNLDARFRYTDKDYTMREWPNLIYDMKLAIKREAWVQLTSALSEEERNERADRGVIECGLLFQYPVIIKNPAEKPEDFLMTTDLEWVSAEVMDDPGKGRLPSTEPVLIGVDGMITDKSIELCGINDDPLTPEDPEPGRI